MNNKFLVVLFLTAAMLSCQKQTAVQTDPIEQQIDSLLSLMTLDEKIGQMNQLNGGWISEDIGAQIRDGQVGSLLNSVGYEEVMYYQRIAVEETRLGIPLIFARDVIHGFSTIWPIPLGQAATWNPALVEDAARLTAEEATQTGLRWTFSPMVDIARDPRWGRIAEGYGEDTYLASKMGAATVRGYQGDNPDSIPANRLAACVKHFAAYGASESGRDYNTTWIPEVLLRDVYLPPFKAAVDAGAASVMCSFNDINGIPSSANRHLNIDILRQEWGFTGVLESDWWSSSNMTAHGYAKDLKQATVQSVNAGMDMDMEGHGYIYYIHELIDEGVLTVEQVDNAVRNILRMKFRLGLFDNPYTAVPEPLFHTEEALASATRAVEESAILLKNNGVLPLTIPAAGEKPLNILLCGPLANSVKDQVGTWCFDVDYDAVITPLKAFRELEQQQNIRLIWQQGLAWSREQNQAAVEKTVNAAKDADVVLFFAGEESILSGEARCRADISLPGMQTKMLEMLHAIGKPVVMIVMAGRPLTIGKEVELADAVLYSYHGGTMAGTGLKNVLTGVVSPSGRCPVTMPQMVGQIPIYYNRKNTGRPTSTPVLIDDIPVGAPQFSLGESSYWLEMGDKPLFPFGYGLTYTTFSYSPVFLSDSIISQDEVLHVACVVTNTGNRPAHEVVQLYVRDLVGDCRPVRELKRFEKVYLEPGEYKEVQFTLTADDLKYWHNEYIDGSTSRVWHAADPGDFQIWIAPDCTQGTPATFTLQ